MKTRIAAVCLLTLGLIGCNGAKQDKEAVRQTVIEHVTKNSGLNMADMDVQITSLNFHGKEADVTAAFQAKAGGAPVQFRYNLEDQNGKWVVKGKAMPASGMHDGTGGPQGPGGNDATPPSALPPGHPSIPQQGGGSSK